MSKAQHFGYTEDQWEVRDDGPFCSGEPERPETVTEKRLVEYWLDWETGLTVVTNESWGGTYAGGKLRLELYEHRKPDAPTTWTICVHGTDDWSMYLRDIPDRDWALSLMRRVPIVIDSDVLRGLGFEP